MYHNGRMDSNYVLGTSCTYFKKILTNLMKSIVVCQWFIDKCLYWLNVPSWLCLCLCHRRVGKNFNHSKLILLKKHATAANDSKSIFFWQFEIPEEWKKKFVKQVFPMVYLGRVWGFVSKIHYWQCKSISNFWAPSMGQSYLFVRIKCR